MKVHLSLIPGILRQGVTVTAAAAIVPVLAAVAAPASAAASPAARYSFTVNSTADSHDASPGNGVCADSLGRCTLRAAIEEAGADPAGSTISISVPAGTYKLTLGSLTESANTITVTGAGASSTTVEATGPFRVLQIKAKVIATLTGVTITAGNAGDSGYGGGVLTSGTTTISRAAITANSAASGGGLSNSGGKLTIDGSTISGNAATLYGGAGIQNGGLNNLAGTIKLISSTVSKNTANGDGGGILNGQNGHPGTAHGPAVPRVSFTVRPGGARPWLTIGRDEPRAKAAGRILTVTNSRISNNASNNAGGGIANDGGTATLTGSTLSGNTCPHATGGGISNYGPLTVIKSTLTGNSSSGGYGGGIETFSGGVAGSTTISQSTLTGNQAQIGGGIDNSATTVNVSQSTLTGNNAEQAGGAIEEEGSSAINVINSTLTANTTTMAGNGGGIQTFECSGGTLAYTTITGNSTGLALSCSTLKLTGTIVASSTSGNCIGAPPTESAGYNLDSGTSCGFALATDLNSTNPDLGPLGNNGGPTRTELPRPGSPAINNGGTPATGCPQRRPARRPPPLRPGLRHRLGGGAGLS